MTLDIKILLGAYETAVSHTLSQLQQHNIIGRIWAHDHTVWRPDPTEITNRLGWLHCPENMKPEIGRIQAFVAGVQADGFTDVLLLGMGGSSLAPELFYKTFGGDGLRLAIVDTTDADAIRALANSVDLSKTLFIVATKSGGTVETLSAFKYFYNETAKIVGKDKIGQHFIAITDPGSSLEKLAQQYQFRQTFLNDPNIGGRYSALSFFGLVPAALVGADLAVLLERAQAAAADHNAGAQVGAIMGALALAGRDKITFLTSPALTSFGDWAEQLIAESTGKEGKGIVPVVGEAVGVPAVYGEDRLFVHLKLAGDGELDSAVSALTNAGHPTVTCTLQDVYDVGGQFMLWEMATAVSGHILDIQPFDQPNVEAAKILARKVVAAYMEKGELPQGESAPVTAESLHTFLSQTKPGDYISLQAYVYTTAETEAALQTLRTRLRDQYKLATTLGYGPRFLHSTGQLHKGDSGNGLFIQFTSDPIQDTPIPDEAGKPASTMSFGVLKMAQALGDGQALLENGRRFIRFHLGADVIDGIDKLKR